jgi:hypothetical protein
MTVKNVTTKVCPTCLESKSIEQFKRYGNKLCCYCIPCKKEKDRLSAEKARRAKGIAKVKGTEHNCHKCGVIYTRKVAHGRYCSPCADKVTLESARIKSLQKARERGNRVMGSSQKCKNCGVVYILEKRCAKYCKECKVLSNNNALPFMREWQKSYKLHYYKNPVNKRRTLDVANELRRKRLQNDPLYVMIGRIRARIRGVFRANGYSKSCRTFEIIGCSYEYLKEHLESKFVDGMAWENRNLWHIDHIIPLSYAKSEQDIIKLSHYTNLQPLWAIENLRKSNRITHSFSELAIGVNL